MTLARAKRFENPVGERLDKPREEALTIFEALAEADEEAGP